MKKAPLLFAGLAFLIFHMPAQAHHPGAGLDQLMHNKEKFFQVIDVPSAPSFELADTDGKTVHLSDFSDKIVILNFIFANCDDVCPLHSELIAKIQAMINATPMKDRVQFISVTTDPANDTLDVMKTYGPTHGLDLYNWTFLTTRLGQPEDTTRKLAKEYGLRFDQVEGGQQMHSIVTHIIDRGGRFAAKFHGLRFDPLNAVLYVNGLTNNASPRQTRELGWWGTIKRLFD